MAWDIFFRSVIFRFLRIWRKCLFDFFYAYIWHLYKRHSQLVYIYIYIPYYIYIYIIYIYIQYYIYISYYIFISYYIYIYIYHIYHIYHIIYHIPLLTNRWKNKYNKKEFCMVKISLNYSILACNVILNSYSIISKTYESHLWICTDKFKCYKSTLYLLWYIYNLINFYTYICKSTLH